MTKDQLQAENERLGMEVAALRGLLTAIAGGKHPMYVAGQHDRYYQAGSDRMIAVAGAAKAAVKAAGTDDFAMTAHAMANYLDHEFARPLGYTPKAAPAPVITDSERDCDERNPDGSGEPCHRGGDHFVHRDSNGDEWRADGPVTRAEDIPDEMFGSPSSGLGYKS